MIVLTFYVYGSGTRLPIGASFVSLEGNHLNPHKTYKKFTSASVTFSRADCRALFVDCRV